MLKSDRLVSEKYFPPETMRLGPLWGNKKKCFREPYTDPNCFTLRNLAIVPMLSQKRQNVCLLRGNNYATNVKQNIQTGLSEQTM